MSSLYELFPAFICVNSIRSLVNSLSGIKIFNPLRSFSSSSSLSSSAMVCISTNYFLSPSSGDMGSISSFYHQF